MPDIKWQRATGGPLRLRDSNSSSAKSSFGSAREADPTAAAERLNAVADIPLLAVNEAAGQLAAALIRGYAIPETEPEDALHVAIAAVHGVEYLVTWNFRHIANAALLATIDDVCRQEGCEPPIICTPEQLTDPQKP